MYRNVLEGWLVRKKDNGNIRVRSGIVPEGSSGCFPSRKRIIQHSLNFMDANQLPVLDGWTPQNCCGTNKTVPPMANITKATLPGIKNSEMPVAIKKSLELSYEYFEKVYGEDGARNMIDTLTQGYIRDLDNYKPLRTANALFMARIPVESGTLVGQFANLKVHGTLKPPVETTKTVIAEHGEKADDEKTDGEKIESEKTDGEKTDGEKADAENPDAEKADGEKTQGTETAVVAELSSKGESPDEKQVATVIPSLGGTQKSLI